jgi:uncharacterized protein
VELYAIPFRGRFLLYRPLLGLAFAANGALVRHVRDRLSRPARPGSSAADRFLEDIGFWQPDPPPPRPWAPAGEHRPTTAVLLLTSACNLRCTYCYARGGEDPRYNLDPALARKVVDAACDNARSLGRDRFAVAFHGGGEPTVRWDVLAGAVAHARSRELPCAISMATNGVWSRAKRRFIVEHFDELSISFDGVQPVQDAQRPRSDGRGSFGAVLETLEALDENGLRYGIRMTATPGSFPRMAESVAFLCRTTGCRVFQIEPAFSDRRGGHADPSPGLARAFVRAFRAAHRVAAAEGRLVFYSGARPWAVGGDFCRAAEDALVVTPEGDLVTCFETHDRRHPLIGQLTIGRATPGGLEIDAARLGALARRRRARRAGCRGCFCFWHCAGDCEVRRLGATGPRSGRCLVNRWLCRELLAAAIADSGGVWRAATGPAPGLCAP